MREWRQRFGYEYEVLFPGIRRLFTTGKEVVPADSGGAKLTEYLWWTMRELASNCRCVYEASGMIPFEFQGPRTPLAFARALDHWFDLALLDPISIRERGRRLGVDADTGKWPAYWVEREDILLLAEERQVTIPAAPGRIAASVRRKWEACLHVVGNAAEIGIPNAATKDKHSFLAGVLVAVHKQPPGKARKRPSLDDSQHRHEELVTALGQVSEAELRPVTRHALWRLPPGMVVADPPRSDPCMHYPAVSVVSSVAPLTDSRRNGEACS